MHSAAYDFKNIVPSDALTQKAQEAHRLIHKTIQYVTDDFERYHFNKAIARLRELSNSLFDLSSENPQEMGVLSFGLKTLCQLMAPIVPHLAEELWQMLSPVGHESVINAGWPKADHAFIEEQNVVLAVQVNGKLRGELTIPKETSPEEVEKLACELEVVQKYSQGCVPKKIIVIQGRIVNVVF